MKSTDTVQCHDLQYPFERLETTLACVAHGALAIAVLTLVLFYRHVSAAL